MIEGRVLCILENMDKRKTRASARRQQPKNRTGKQKFVFLVGCVFVCLAAWNLTWVIETFQEVKGLLYYESAVAGSNASTLSCSKENAAKLLRGSPTFLGVKVNASEKEFRGKNPKAKCFDVTGGRRCEIVVWVKEGENPFNAIDALVKGESLNNNVYVPNPGSYDGEYLATARLNFIDDKLKQLLIEIHGDDYFQEPFLEKYIEKKTTELFGPSHSKAASLPIANEKMVSDLIGPPGSRNTFSHPKTSCTSSDANKFHLIPRVKDAWGMKGGYVFIRVEVTKKFDITYLYLESDDFPEIQKKFSSSLRWR